MGADALRSWHRGRIYSMSSSSQMSGEKKSVKLMEWFVSGNVHGTHECETEELSCLGKGTGSGAS